MPDISNIGAGDTVGFDGRGGLSSSADGDFALSNDAATDSFTIDVDGSAGITIADNEVAVNTGDELRVYTVGAPGAADYSCVRIHDDGSGRTRLTSERGGSGGWKSLGFDTGNEHRFYRQGSDVFIISADYIAPLSAAAADLGSQTANREWRDLFLRPSSSLTPTDNGNLCIEATDNTTLTFKYRGSDGTVRSGTVALS